MAQMLVNTSWSIWAWIGGRKTAVLKEGKCMKMLDVYNAMVMWAVLSADGLAK